MSFYVELTVQQKISLGLPAEEKLFVELLPPENTPITVVSGEDPFFRIGIMRVGDKTIQWQELSKEYLKKAYPHIRNLPTLEDLPDHIKAVEARIRKEDNL